MVRTDPPSTDPPSTDSPIPAEASRVRGALRDLADVPSFAALHAAALVPWRGERRGEALTRDRTRVRQVHLDADRSAAFDHLLGARASRTVHPGLLHALAYPVTLSLLASPTAPVPILGLALRSTSLLMHRPIAVGERVDVEAAVRGLQDGPRGRTFEAVTTISAGGRIVATDVSTYLASRRGDEAPAVRRCGAEAFVPPVPTGRWSLRADAGSRFAAVTGDADPIHLSRLAARALGLDGAIAHGTHVAARTLEAARELGSRELLQGPCRWDVELDAPVILPGSVLVRTETEHGTAAATMRTVGWLPAREGRAPRRCIETTITALG